MKILLMSYAYPPSMGGIEVFSSLMRAAFQAQGHEVQVMTEVQAAMPEDSEHRVLRNPDRTALKEAIAWADLCYVSGVSMRYEIPVLLSGKPMVITHHGGLSDIDGKLDNIYRLKRLLCRYALNISISRALASDLPAPVIVLHNPLPSEIELGPEFQNRPRDLVFVGRLVRDKGVNVLLDAMIRLRERGVAALATIVGDGNERSSLERQASDAKLAGSVEFPGGLPPSRIHPILLQHKMLVAPSVWREPFGLVVLEGLAAGCMVLGSNAGGLPESIGPCGLTFPAGDSDVLAALIEKLLAHPELAVPYRQAIPAHLDPLRLDRVARCYLDIFERLFHYRTARGMGRRKAIQLAIEELRHS